MRRPALAVPKEALYVGRGALPFGGSGRDVVGARGRAGIPSRAERAFGCSGLPCGEVEREGDEWDVVAGHGRLLGALVELSGRLEDDRHQTGATVLVA